MVCLLVGFSKVFRLVLLTSTFSKVTAVNLGHAVLCQRKFAKYCQLCLPEARKKKNTLLHHFNSSNKTNLKSGFGFPFCLVPRNKKRKRGILAVVPVITFNYRGD